MDFNDCGYLVVESAISKDTADILSMYALIDELTHPVLDGRDVPNAHFRTNEPLTRTILHYLQPRVEEITSLKLIPTSSHLKVYRQGSILPKHHDRKECCQVTASINVGNYFPEGYAGYPVYLEDQPFILDVGDMLLFRGHGLNHSRDMFELDREFYQIQYFVHYIEQGSVMDLSDDEMKEVELWKMLRS
jgi:hypothetical protein